MVSQIRGAVGSIVVALLGVTACGADSPRSAETSEGGTAVEESPAASAPVEPPPQDDLAARFDPSLFDGESTTIDNPWWPLTPGMQMTYEGSALDAEEEIERKAVFTVTDLSKEIGGVRTLVGWERDYNDDAMTEAELVFLAQDRDGNVWHLGQYTETFEDDELVGGRMWVVGDPEGARAGIFMPANSQLGDDSYSQGYAPPPWNWDDRARVHDVGVRTCVRVDCYEDVLVIEEYEPSIPEALQLKFYARDVGLVRIGWAGANESEQEELELVERVTLTPEQMAEARAAALELEHRAYGYGRTPPSQQIGTAP